MVRAARRRARMTQRELASAAGMPQPSVARIERGVVTARVDTLVRLLEAAGHELAVQPKLGIGIDRTLIADRLRMTPAERVRLGVQEAHALARFRGNLHIRAKQ